MAAAPTRPNDPSGGKRRTSRPASATHFLHSAIDGNTRLAYTEARDNETAATAIEFMNNARLFFAAHGITRIERVITDNGSCYRAADFTASLREARHYRIKPYTPKHNGKVERYNRILAEELLYSREYTGEQQRRTAVEVQRTAVSFSFDPGSHLRFSTIVRGDGCDSRRYLARFSPHCVAWVTTRQVRSTRRTRRTGPTPNPTRTPVPSKLM